MLDRATLCVEPGINLLLRRSEIPSRSSRVLPPSFWQNRVAQQSAPQWWPAYLQDVRQIKFAQSGSSSSSRSSVDSEHDGVPARGSVRYLNSTQRPTASLSKLAIDPAQSFPQGNRAFSVYRCELVESSTGVYRDEVGEIGGLLHGQGDGDDFLTASEQDADRQASEASTSYTGGPVNIPAVTNSNGMNVPSTLDSLYTILNSRDSKAYGQAWQLFIHLGAPVTAAGDMLIYLATSHRQVDLDRAVRTYNLIPSSERSTTNYQSAIKAACGRKQKRIALNIHREAVKRGMYWQPTNLLLSFLIRHSLWRSATQVWDSLPVSDKNAANPRNHSLWSETDQYIDLPQKLLQLMEQLEHHPAKYGAWKGPLSSFCVQLLFRVLSSPPMLARITASGTLALLDRFSHLDLLRPHHYFSGIQTLNKMMSSRNRHQLATLLYKNMDMRFPDARLPRSVLGSLIGILCGSDSEHAASRVVLRRFARDQGKPDPMAYQKVLSACAANGDSVHLREVFDEFCKDYGKPTSLAFVTPLLYVHARVGNVTETNKQFDLLEPQFAFQPNTYCWNILITAYARAHDHEGAFQKFRDMRRAGLDPDEYTYGILMGICAKSGDTEAIHQLVESAKEHRIKGTTAMVDTLVHSYCLNDQVEDAENLVEAATQMGLKGSPTRMWNILLRHHAFRADTEAVLRTQARMKELSVAADDMTYAALMQSLVTIGKTRDAANILRSLHFSTAVTATMFHYSIILYGYASENNRDMVAVIYHEMVERFPGISMSAQFSRLRTFLHRDMVISRQKSMQALPGKPMNRGLRLKKSFDFLAEVLLDFDQKELAKKEPQPGLGRKTAAAAFPSVYFEFLVAALVRHGALEKAEHLLNRYQDVRSASGFGQEPGTTSLQMMSTMMMALVQQKRFAAVEKYWSKALSLGIERGRRLRPKLTDPTGETAKPQAVGPPDARAIGLQTPATDLGVTLKSPFLGESTVSILPAHRYILAAPLTQYIHALGAQNLATNLPPLVKRLEDMGFSLTGKNWNHVIQALAYSNDPDLQIIAFQLFEEKLLPDMPSWQVMRRSKWTKQKTVDGSREVFLQEPVQRRLVERFQPHNRVPTYWTMVYLGLALMKAQERSFIGEEFGLPLLKRGAPGTVAAVSRMPYLREKAQGLLLRGRSLRGDPVKRPRRPPKADRAGLRGSRSPIDHIPLDHPLRGDPVPKRDEPLLGKKVRMKKISPIQVAEKVLGESQRNPLVLEAAGRYEDEREYTRRLQAEKDEKLRIGVQIYKDAAQIPIMADEKYGEPFFEAKLQDRQPKRASNGKTEVPVKDQQGLLGAALEHSVSKRQPAPDPVSPSKDPSDIRPAAVLSAALRPRAAARLHLIRRRKRKPPAISLDMRHFAGSLRRKVVQALMAFQPPQQIPNRLLQAFTRNRVARNARKLAKTRSQSISAARHQSRR